jgi:hypothetical protein
LLCILLDARWYSCLLCALSIFLSLETFVITVYSCLCPQVALQQEPAPEIGPGSDPGPSPGSGSGSGLRLVLSPSDGGPHLPLPPDFDFEIVAQRESSGGFQAPSLGLGLPLEGVVSEVFASAVSASPAGSHGESVSGRLPPGDLSPVSVWWRDNSSFEPFTRLPLGGIDLAAGLSAPRLERVPVVWGSGLGGRGQLSAGVAGVVGPRAALVVEAPGAESFLGRISGSGLPGRFLRSAQLADELFGASVPPADFFSVRAQREESISGLLPARREASRRPFAVSSRLQMAPDPASSLAGGGEPRKKKKPRPPLPRPGEGLGWGAGFSSPQPGAGAEIPLTTFFFFFFLGELLYKEVRAKQETRQDRGTKNRTSRDRGAPLAA